MKLLALVASTFFLCGCAAPTPATFAQGSAPRQQYVSDNYACERDAKMIQGGDCRQMNMYESCMESKGYTAIPGTANKGSSCR